MPELPEVETTRRGLLPHLLGSRLLEQRWNRADLRWPIPLELHTLTGRHIVSVERRAKYLLIKTEAGSALWHLGMSGSLRMFAPEHPWKPHDHVGWKLDSGLWLRFNDPRRFGCYLFQAPGEQHPLLAKLGPEPLDDAFSAAYLRRKALGKTVAVKQFLMDQATVVGVGNIYAAESLFLAGIRPQKPAGTVSSAAWTRLTDAVKKTIAFAITRGGTTLRDFLNPEGEPGYFAQELWVYGRAGQPCKRCASTILALQAARQTNYCPRCQR